ncbi:HalOD1 output domain-containing protein [Natronomonas sp.]|uniref:HalOD1 output domain-containing protein n=1 Tax=Natronomonas sp. TaxID=2184060 RepID=UPI0037CAFF5D
MDESDDPASAIIDAFATHKQIEATELPPLYDAIDPEIINTLSEPGEGGNRRHVTFQYCGCEIAIHADAAR